LSPWPLFSIHERPKTVDARRTWPEISTGHRRDTSTDDKLKSLILLALPRGVHELSNTNMLAKSGTAFSSMGSLCFLSRVSHQTPLKFGNTRPSPLTAFRRSPMPLTGGGIIPSLPRRRREHCLPELLADLVMAVMPPRLPAAPGPLRETDVNGQCESLIGSQAGLT
jgi:hypothetical protein